MGSRSELLNPSPNALPEFMPPSDIRPSIMPLISPMSPVIRPVRSVMEYPSKKLVPSPFPDSSAWTLVCLRASFILAVTSSVASVTSLFAAIMPSPTPLVQSSAVALDSSGSRLSFKAALLSVNQSSISSPINGKPLRTLCKIARITSIMVIKPLPKALRPTPIRIKDAPAAAAAADNAKIPTAARIMFPANGPKIAPAAPNTTNTAAKPKMACIIFENGIAPSATIGGTRTHIAAAITSIAAPALTISKDS